VALIDDFKSRFPEFETSVVDQYFPTLESIWPCYYALPYDGCNQEIILNLIAHLLVIQSSAGSAPVKEESGKTIGSISLNFESRSEKSGLSDFFGSTKYGQMYMHLTSTRRRVYFV